ncbi:MAG TPA: xanthine dehydrogenase family protein subunit M [Caldilineaceae bacterium]|nr:xanthine dehydrogenase family protein subunit M [Caldilineaceae bacterium]
MYPPKFDYYRASSVDEALSLLQTHTGAKLLAGGHSLLPALKLRLADPGVLIDIGRIPQLKGIERRTGSVYIGALTTHAMVAAAEGLPAALTEAAALIGDPAVRNRGTVGGNVAHADPASDLPTVLVALDARFHVTGPGGARTIPADDFFVDLFTTALQEGEILTGIEIPMDGDGSAYVKFENPASRYALLGVAAALRVRDGRCIEARVAVGGLTPKATRARAVEQALINQPLDEQSLAEAAGRIDNDLGDDVMGDIHASAEYRRAVAPVFVQRALTLAAQRA